MLKSIIYQCSKCGMEYQSKASQGVIQAGMIICVNDGNRLMIREYVHEVVKPKPIPKKGKKKK